MCNFTQQKLSFWNCFYFILITADSISFSLLGIMGNVLFEDAIIGGLWYIYDVTPALSLIVALNRTNGVVWINKTSYITVSRFYKSANPFVT